MAVKADAIKVVASLECNNDNFKLPKEGGTTQLIDQQVIGGGGPGTVEIGVAEEDIDFGDIATLGIVRITNMDPANFVKWGPKSGTAAVFVGRILFGESFVWRLEPGVTLRMIADTAAVKCKITCLEN